MNFTTFSSLISLVQTFHENTFRSTYTVLVHKKNSHAEFMSFFAKIATYISRKHYIYGLALSITPFLSLFDPQPAFPTN